jgi:hypothetical protein
VRQIGLRPVNGVVSLHDFRPRRMRPSQCPENWLLLRNIGSAPADKVRLKGELIPEYFLRLAALYNPTDGR